MADVIASMWLMLLPLFVLYLADLIANVADVIATFFIHSYVLLDRSILCNCYIKTESNFLLESLATSGEHKKTDLEMYFTINLAFAKTN